MQNINGKMTLVLTSALLLIPAAQAVVPESVQVPAGNQLVMETLGIGEITYECKAADTGKPAWVFMGPDAMLKDSAGNETGRYFGPPATWQSADGSSATGKQLAVAPGGDGNIPLQLVQANPADGEGAMTGVTYIQRLNTQGGVAPAMDCSEGNQGDRQVVQYQADYLFWKAG